MNSEKRATLVMAIILAVILLLIGLIVFLSQPRPEPPEPAPPTTLYETYSPKNQGTITLKQIYELYIYLQTEQNLESIRLNNIKESLKQEIRTLEIHVEVLSDVCNGRPVKKEKNHGKVKTNNSRIGN